MLSETRAAATRREREREERERGRNETTGLKCILILRVDLHNCFDYAVSFPDGIAVDCGGGSPILDFVV